MQKKQCKKNEIKQKMKHGINKTSLKSCTSRMDMNCSLLGEDPFNLHNNFLHFSVCKEKELTKELVFAGACPSTTKKARSIKGISL